MKIEKIIKISMSLFIISAIFIQSMMYVNIYVLKDQNPEIDQKDSQLQDNNIINNNNVEPNEIHSSTNDSINDYGLQNETLNYEESTDSNIQRDLTPRYQITEDWRRGESMRVDYGAINNTVRLGNYQIEYFDFIKRTGNQYNMGYSGCYDMHWNPIDNKIYALCVSTTSEKIVIFDTDLNQIGTFGSKSGTYETGAFNRTKGFGINATGYFFVRVTDQIWSDDPKIIQVFDPDYNYVGNISTEFYRGGFSLGEGGEIIFNSTGYMYHLESNYTASSGTTNATIGIYDPNDYTYIRNITSSCYEEQTEFATDIALSKDENYIYVACVGIESPNTDRIEKIDVYNGTIVGQWGCLGCLGSNLLNDVHELMVDEADNLWVTTDVTGGSGNGEVYFLLSNLTRILTFKDGMANPAGLSQDTSGNVYILDNYPTYPKLNKYGYLFNTSGILGDFNYARQDDGVTMNVPFTLGNVFLRYRTTFSFTLYNIINPDLLGINVGWFHNDQYNLFVDDYATIPVQGVFGSDELVLTASFESIYPNASITLSAFDTFDNQIVTDKVWSYIENITDTPELFNYTYISTSSFQDIFQFDYIWAESLGYESSLGSEVRYTGNSDIVEHRIDIEVFEYRRSFEIYAPLDMNFSRIEPNAVVTLVGDNYVISNTIPVLYTIYFLSGNGFGRDHAREKSILAIDDVNDNFFIDPGFETNNWYLDFERNDAKVESETLNYTYFSDGIASLRLESTDSDTDYLGTDKLPSGRYYVTFDYYFESFTQGSFTYEYVTQENLPGWTGQQSEVITQNTTVVTGRWYHHASFFDQSIGTYQFWRFYFFQFIGVVFLDNVHFYQANTDIEILTDTSMQTSSQFLYLTPYGQIVAPNEPVMLELRDKTSNEIIDNYINNTDEDGLFIWNWAGRLDFKEYEMRAIAFNNWFNGRNCNYDCFTESTTDWLDNNGDMTQSLSTDSLFGQYSIRTSGTPSSTTYLSIYRINMNSSNFQINWVKNVDYWVTHIKAETGGSVDLRDETMFWIGRSDSNWVGWYEDSSYYYTKSNPYNLISDVWDTFIFDIDNPNTIAGGLFTLDNMYRIYPGEIDIISGNPVSLLYDGIQLIQAQKTFFTPKPVGYIDFAQDNFGYWDFSEGELEFDNAWSWSSENYVEDGAFVVSSDAMRAYLYGDSDDYYNHPLIDSDYYDQLFIRFKFNATEYNVSYSSFFQTILADGIDFSEGDLENLIFSSEISKTTNDYYTNVKTDTVNFAEDIEDFTTKTEAHNPEQLYLQFEQLNEFWTDQGDANDFGEGDTEGWTYDDVYDADNFINFAIISGELRAQWTDSPATDYIMNMKTTGLSVDASIYNYLSFDFRSTIYDTINITVYDASKTNVVCTQAQTWTASSQYTFTCQLNSIYWTGTETELYLDFDNGVDFFNEYYFDNFQIIDTRLIDSSEYLYHGSTGDSLQFSSAVYGSGADFVGSSTSIADSGAMEFNSRTQAITIAFWVYWDGTTTGSEEDPIAIYGNTTVPPIELRFTDYSYPRLETALVGSIAQWSWDGSGSCGLNLCTDWRNTWEFLVIELEWRSDGHAYVEWWVNNTYTYAEVDYGVKSYPQDIASPYWRFGHKDGYTNNYFQGSLDEFKVINRIITSQERTDLMNNVSLPNEFMQFDNPTWDSTNEYLVVDDHNQDNIVSFETSWDSIDATTYNIFAFSFYGVDTDTIKSITIKSENDTLPLLYHNEGWSDNRWNKIWYYLRTDCDYDLCNGGLSQYWWNGTERFLSVEFDLTTSGNMYIDNVFLQSNKTFDDLIGQVHSNNIMEMYLAQNFLNWTNFDNNIGDDVGGFLSRLTSTSLWEAMSDAFVVPAGEEWIVRSIAMNMSSYGTFPSGNEGEIGIYNAAYCNSGTPVNGYTCGGGSEGWVGNLSDPVGNFSFGALSNNFSLNYFEFDTPITLTPGVYGLVFTDHNESSDNYYQWFEDYLDAINETRHVIHSYGGGWALLNDRTPYWRIQYTTNNSINDYLWNPRITWDYGSSIIDSSIYYNLTFKLSPYNTYDGLHQNNASALDIIENITISDYEGNQVAFFNFTSSPLENGTWYEYTTLLNADPDWTGLERGIYFDFGLQVAMDNPGDSISFEYIALYDIDPVGLNLEINDATNDAIINYNVGQLVDMNNKWLQLEFDLGADADWTNENQDFFRLLFTNDVGDNWTTSDFFWIDTISLFHRGSDFYRGYNYEFNEDVSGEAEFETVYQPLVHSGTASDSVMVTNGYLSVYVNNNYEGIRFATGGSYLEYWDSNIDQMQIRVRASTILGNTEVKLGFGLIDGTNQYYYFNITEDWVILTIDLSGFTPDIDSYIWIEQAGGFTDTYYFDIDWIRLVETTKQPNVVDVSYGYFRLSQIEDEDISYKIWLDNISLGTYSSFQDIPKNITAGYHVIHYSAFKFTNSAEITLSSILYQYTYEVVDPYTATVTTFILSSDFISIYYTASDPTNHYIYENDLLITSGSSDGSGSSVEWDRQIDIALINVGIYFENSGNVSEFLWFNTTYSNELIIKVTFFSSYTNSTHAFISYTSLISGITVNVSVDGAFQGSYSSSPITFIKSDIPGQHFVTAEFLKTNYETSTFSFTYTVDNFEIENLQFFTDLSFVYLYYASSVSGVNAELSEDGTLKGDFSTSPANYTKTASEGIHYVTAIFHKTNHRNRSFLFQYEITGIIINNLQFFDNGTAVNLLWSASVNHNSTSNIRVELSEFGVQKTDTNYYIANYNKTDIEGIHYVTATFYLNGFTNRSYNFRYQVNPITFYQYLYGFNDSHIFLNYQASKIVNATFYLDYEFQKVELNNDTAFIAIIKNNTKGDHILIVDFEREGYTTVTRVIQYNIQVPPIIEDVDVLVESTNQIVDQTQQAISAIVLMGTLIGVGFVLSVVIVYLYNRNREEFRNFAKNLPEDVQRISQERQTRAEKFRKQRVVRSGQVPRTIKRITPFKD